VPGEGVDAMLRVGRTLRLAARSPNRPSHRPLVNHRRRGATQVDAACAGRHQLALSGYPRNFGD